MCNKDHPCSTLYKMQRNSRGTKPGVYYFETDTLKVIFHWCCEAIAVIMQHTCVIKWQTLVMRKFASIQTVLLTGERFLRSTRRVYNELPLNLYDYRVYLLPSGQMYSTHQNFFVTYPFVKHKTSMKCLWRNNTVYLSRYVPTTSCDSFYCYFIVPFFVPEGKLQVRWKSIREPVTNIVKLI